jgi:carbon-monoxide dehydrogenase small subunit
MPELRITVNGVPRQVDVDVRLLLVEALRDVLGLTGPKIGCGTGDCGACTVGVDGRAMKSCLLLAVSADGAEITTLDGLSDGTDLHPLQRAFCEEKAFQCGFCLSGMLFATRQSLPVHRLPEPRPSRAKGRSGQGRIAAHRGVGGTGSPRKPGVTLSLSDASSRSAPPSRSAPSPGWTNMLIDASPSASRSLTPVNR